MGAELTEPLGQWTGMPTLFLAADDHSTNEVDVHLRSPDIMVSRLDSCRYVDTDGHGCLATWCGNGTWQRNSRDGGVPHRHDLRYGGT